MMSDAFTKLNAYGPTTATRGTAGVSHDTT